MAYVWAKHEDVDGSVYQVLEGAAELGSGGRVPLVWGTSGLSSAVSWGCPPNPPLGLHPWAHQVTFSEESLPKGHGDFILGYYSHHHSILIGVTEPFQISLPTSELASSSTDSSGTSSEGEDDSTLELLAPKSRSPSPGKSKRHRSRSPGLARFPGLALRPSSRERRAASRSPSPQSRRLSRGTPDRGNSGSSQGSCEEGPSGLPGSWAFPPAVPRSLGLLPALRLETVDPGGGGPWGPEREASAPASLSPSPQGQQGLEEGGLGP